VDLRPDPLKNGTIRSMMPSRREDVRLDES
jgi:hypothetical protein